MRGGRRTELVSMNTCVSALVSASALVMVTVLASSPQSPSTVDSALCRMVGAAATHRCLSG